jgi:hypothetical protein
MPYGLPTYRLAASDGRSVWWSAISSSSEAEPLGVSDGLCNKIS